MEENVSIGGIGGQEDAPWDGGLAWNRAGAPTGLLRRRS